MSNAVSYTRPPFPNRPWITGKQYDDYRRPSILHCDAWVMRIGALKYLVIDWREGGRAQVALDAWLIEPDGLTPIWDASRLSGVPLQWGADGVPWPALHQRVLAQAAQAEGSGRWARVVTQAHYVTVRDTDPMGGLVNRYTERVAD